MGFPSCLVEAQSLFVPCLSAVLTGVGLDVLHVSASIDVGMLGRLRPRVLFVDLDCVEEAPLERLRVSRAVLPNALICVYTDQRGPLWFDQCRAAGADCVIDKASPESDMVLTLAGAIGALRKIDEAELDGAGGNGTDGARWPRRAFEAGGIDGSVRFSS